MNKSYILSIVLKPTFYTVSNHISSNTYISGQIKDGVKLFASKKKVTITRTSNKTVYSLFKQRLYFRSYIILCFFFSNRNFHVCPTNRYIGSKDESNTWRDRSWKNLNHFNRDSFIVFIDFDYNVRNIHISKDVFFE